MKQLTLTMIPLLCAAVAPLCADAQGSQQMNKSAADQQQMYMNEMNKITPSAEPSVTRCADPYVTADFIWWRAHQEGLDYAFKGTTTFEHDADRGQLHNPDFDYEPGFKVGAGLKFRHDGWDLFAQYTWLRVDNDEDRDHIHSDSDGDSQVQSNIFLPIQGDLYSFWAERAHANWSLHFNVIDLELGRNFWISKWLTLRPFIGMKFDWMDQDFHVHYREVQNDSLNEHQTDFNGSDVHMKMDNDQWSVGMRAGLNTSWYMWKKWTIFGDIAVSGILNSFDVSREDRIQTGNNIDWHQNHIHRDYHPVTAVLEWALGLRFETAFHNDDFMFQFQAGWEEQIWFNQNQFLFFPNNAPADLSFQGLTVKAAFYF